MHKKFLYTLLLLTVALSTIIVKASVESSTTTLSINPPMVEYWTPAYGKVFTVNVSLANVLDLKGFEFKLYWNTTLLDLTKVDIQPFLNPPIIILTNETREDLGRYRLGIYSTGPPTSGSGTLAKLSFKTTYDPIWPQNVSCRLDLADTKLSDSGGNPIPHNAYDGEYRCNSTPPLNITIKTTRPSYYLLDSIKIYGNLTLGLSPVQDGLVALEVDNPTQNTVVLRTVLTGTPPTNQKVEVVSVIPCDQNGNPRNIFSRGSLAFFNVTVRNNDIETHPVLIVINPFDVNFASMGITAILPPPLGGGAIAWIQIQFLIPDIASLGDAHVYANALSDWPKAGGTPYCIEKSAIIKIVGGGAGASATQEPQILITSQGTYELTFSLTLDDKRGNYTAYATSDYSGQQTAKSTTFEIKVPDLTGDGVIDIFDLVIVATHYGHLPPDGHSPGSPEYSACFKADITGDGIVDIFDLVLIGRYIGWYET